MPEKKKIVSRKSLSQLSGLVQAAGIHLKPESDPHAVPKEKPEELKQNIQKVIAACNEEEIFREAMNGVHPASWRHDPHPSAAPILQPGGDAGAEALRLMQSALADDKPVPVPDHPEYIEGWVGVAGRKFLPKLRNGLYSIQGQIDLHGYNRIEAQMAVEDYIARMSRFHSCCIKIIHGRGINSPSGIATLKEGLQRLLKTRRMSRYVVAYASAPSCDGGVGAIYVLLRRP